jgi:hypothetical protein
MNCAFSTNLNFDMSVITPLIAPGVTDDPVFGACDSVDIPTDNSDCVICILDSRGAVFIEDAIQI